MTNLLNDEIQELISRLTQANITVLTEPTNDGQTRISIYMPRRRAFIDVNNQYEMLTTLKAIYNHLPIEQVL